VLRVVSVTTTIAIAIFGGACSLLARQADDAGEGEAPTIEGIDGNGTAIGTDETAMCVQSRTVRLH